MDSTHDEKLAELRDRLLAYKMKLAEAEDLLVLAQDLAFSGATRDTLRLLARGCGIAFATAQHELLFACRFIDDMIGGPK